MLRRYGGTNTAALTYVKSLPGAPCDDEVMPRPLPIVDDPSHGSCVRRVPIFAELAPDQQDVVALLARPVDVSQGALLHRAGEATRVLFVVHQGHLKVSHLFPTGRQRLLRVASPGDVVGEHAFLTGAPPDYEVEALEPTQVCAFASADLTRLVAHYPAIALSMLRSLSERLTDAERRLAQTTVDVPSRLAAFLLELPPANGDPARVRLPWPKKDVASYLGTTPESLSRALSGLQQLGAIGVHGADVELRNPAALDALAEPAT